MAALPYFDEIDPSTIDVLLITQYLFPPLSFHPFSFLFFAPSVKSVRLLLNFALKICSFHLDHAASLPYFLEKVMFHHLPFFCFDSKCSAIALIPFSILKLLWFYLQTTFKGRVFMTHATKAIYRLLLSDYVKVSKVSVEDMLFEEQDILRSMDKIEVFYLPEWI